MFKNLASAELLASVFVISASTREVEVTRQVDFTREVQVVATPEPTAPAEPRELNVLVGAG